MIQKKIGRMSYGQMKPKYNFLVKTHRVWRKKGIEDETWLGLSA
jgi:hypothetical protein